MGKSLKRIRLRRVLTIRELPEHSFLSVDGRARYTAVTDSEAVEAFLALSHLEGIIPALSTLTQSHMCYK